MTDIRFQGFWRMDWGLGNPNKTAAILAVIVISVWVIAYMRRWGFWAAISLFTAAGIALIHTYSRGGLIAAFAGLLPVIIFAPRPWPRSRIIATVVSIWIIVGASLYLQAHERYTQGLVKEDRSITNRFEIWKRAPDMIFDSPAGWGIGKAGEAYMNWYQPTDRSENYRTLVNSHLTWLVEFGWPGRILYLMGWAIVGMICMPSARNRWFAVAQGAWIALFVAAIFSSVAETPWVWVLPGVLLVVVLVRRVFTRDWPSFRAWIVPPAFAALAVGGLFLFTTGSGLSKSDTGIVIGKVPPDMWIVVDTQIFGTRYGRPLRDPKYAGKPFSIGLVEKVQDIPDNYEGVVVLSGETARNMPAAAVKKLESTRDLKLINPAFFPSELGTLDKKKIAVVIGEFAQSPAASAWIAQGNSTVLAGVGNYLPDWPGKIFVKSQ